MSYTAPVKDMLFAIEHLANIEQIAQIPGFEDAGLDTAAAVLEECAKFNEGVLAPHSAEPAACGKSVLADAQQLQAALQSHRGNVSAFAKAIGVSRMTVYRYLKKYHLPD